MRQLTRAHRNLPLSLYDCRRSRPEGQFAPWIDAICGGTEARFINRLFGLYA